MLLRRLMLGPVVATIATFAAPAPAARAHVSLLSASPARGAVVDQAPRRVVLRFTAAMEDSFATMRVRGARGDRVDDGTVRPLRGAGGAGLVVGLRPGIVDGDYRTTFRVVSADGHAMTGGLTFSVRRSDLPVPDGAAVVATFAPAVTGDDAGAGVVTRRALDAARALSYAATALVVGVLVFLLACWSPALRAADAAGVRWTTVSEVVAARAAGLLHAGVLLGLGSGVACLWLYTASVAGVSAWDVLAPDAFAEAMATRTGRGHALRPALLVVMAIVLLAVRARGGLPVLRPATLGAVGAVPHPGGMTPVLSGLLLALGLALAAVPSLSGHAGVTDPAVVMVGLDVVHVVAMAAWLGGLLAVLRLMAAGGEPHGGDGARLLAGVAERFSLVALVSVIALALSGVAATVVHLGAVTELTDSAYGRAILVKAFLLGILVALGAVNRRRRLPALRRLAASGASHVRATALLRRTVAAEIGLLVLVLAATGTLVGLAPPA